MQTTESIQHSKAILDAVSIGNVIATITGWLPAFAALLSIVWTGIRIYEWARAKNKGGFSDNS